MTRQRGYGPAMRILAATAMLFAAPAIAASPELRIGAERIGPADIADARAYPQGIDDTAMLVTLEPAAMKRLKDDAPITLLVDGQPLCAPDSPLLGGDGALLLPCFAKRTAAEVAALAKALSGKDPLPESLDDEP